MQFLYQIPINSDYITELYAAKKAENSSGTSIFIIS